MQHRQLHNSESFKDFLFILLLTFFVLLCLLLMLPKQPNISADNALTKKAEFVIMMNWDDKRDIDMDLWVMYDTNKKEPVYYNKRKVNHIALEQDDRGFSSDVLQTAVGKTTQIYVNEEITSIRGIVPGDYIINGHSYPGAGYFDPAKPLDVTVQIIKLNPYALVDMYTLTFTTTEQEKTFAIITIDDNGAVSEIKRDQLSLLRFKVIAQ